ASNELAAKLARRNEVIEKDEKDEAIPAAEMPSMKKYNVYAEFKEFTRKEIQDFRKTFDKYDVTRDNFLDLMDMKLMMEKLGAPQTHLGLKSMIAEVDEDQDDKISFREARPFLIIFRKASLGELEADSGLSAMYANMREIDVDEAGVKGAKNFFEVKVSGFSASSKFEKEILEEKEQRAKEEAEKKERQAAFKQKMGNFQ
ncbi:hypothetical protein CAPTEDRAFT_85565, partial [Capitella teleta]